MTEVEPGKEYRAQLDGNPYRGVAFDFLGRMVIGRPGFWNIDVKDLTDIEPVD